MSDSWRDLESEEEKLLAEFGRSIREIRAEAARCPAPAAIRAARSGALPQDLEASVVRHLEGCAICSALASDLGDSGLAQLMPEEEGRIRERVFGSLAKPDRGFATPARGEQAPTRGRDVTPRDKPYRGHVWKWLWQPVPIAAGAALLLMISMWTYMRLRQPEPQGALIAQGRESVVFPLEKPPVKLPAESALIWRGQSGTEKEKLLADLGAALAFYRKDDYDTAARYLEQFTRQYPDSAEGHFYLGISLIFRERNTEAASALENAKRLAAGPLARDARWYLGLAYQREGKTALALAEWQELCANGGEYQSKACSAAQQLSPR